MIRTILIAATVLTSASAFAEAPVRQPAGQTVATSYEIAANIPAGISADARARIQNLLDNAEATQDTVFADAWRRLAQDEIRAAGSATAGSATQVAETR